MSRQLKVKTLKIHSKTYLKEAIRYINSSNKQMSGSEMISGLIDYLMNSNSDNEFSSLSSNNAKHFLFPSSQM